MSGVTDWSARFDAAFRTVADTVQRRVWRAVLGDEFPEEVDPYSYVSRTELHQLVGVLRVGPGDLLADVGCGRGGPGLWLAATTGADLVGVDISAVALEAATARAAARGLDGRATYRLGSFAATGLDAACVDAVVSIDALLFAPDKRAAVAELARVLRPGGRLAATTWDYHSQPAGRPPQVADHRPLLDEAGLTVLSYLDTADWRHRVTAIGAGLLAAVDEIAAESGEPVDTVRARLEEAQRTQDAMIRRVMMVAERR